MSKDKKEKVKQQGCSECDNKERRLAITKILSGTRYATKEDQEFAIESFYNSKLTEAEIESIMAPGKSDYLAGQIHRKGVF